MATFKGTISGDIDVYDIKEMVWWLREYADVNITVDFREVPKEEIKDEN